jgi:hypothetical protein
VRHKIWLHDPPAEPRGLIEVAMPGTLRRASVEL